MEIQTQMPMNSAAAASAGAAAGNANSASGQGAGGFLSTLVGILGNGQTNEAAAQQAAVTPGLSALIQLLGTSDNAAVPTQGAADETVLKQLDALIDLLNQNSEDTAALLANPELQALLAQLQAALLVQPTAQSINDETAVETSDASAISAQPIHTDAASDVETDGGAVELNPALFVPADSEQTADQAVDADAAPVFKPVSRQEAQEILKQLQQLLQNGEAETPVTVNGKPLTLQSVAAELRTILAQQITVRHTNETTAVSSPLTVAAPAVNSNLEYLAAKSGSFRFEAQTDSHDSPLFEPLTDMISNNDDMQPVPMSEYLKQVSNGTHSTKTPIVMHAPTFVEDMTQLVMKSFSINSFADGVTEAKLSLYPQHLGHVEIKLTMHNGQLIAQFMADSVSGKEMLESQLSQLRTTLQNQGIQVDKLEVSQNQAFQSGLFQEQRQQQFQQSGKQSKGTNGDNSISMEDELVTAAKEVKLPSGLSSTSIDVTA